MANLCVQYLNFECFAALRDIQTFVAAGAYAFQEYATLNWIYHTQLIFKSDTSHDGEELATLMRSFSLLKSTHCEMLSRQRQSLGLENTDQENSDPQAGLSLLRKIYESIYSILGDKECEGLPLR